MKVLLILISGIFGLVSLQAQDNFCGTVYTQEMHKALQDNKNHWNRDLKSQVPRFIPVTFLLVADNNGNRRASETSAYQALCTLNERYDASGVDLFFYVKQFEEINDSGIHTDPFSAGFRMRNLKKNFTMNIFIVDDIDNGNPDSVTRGFYSPAGDYLVVRKDDLGDTGYTLEHEIGHFFTLKHPHYGWEDESYNQIDYPEKITFTTISGSTQVPQGLAVPVELVDGSNCETAADCLCDTPADYGIGFSCNCCVMPYAALDANCDTLVTMFDNVMAYSDGCGERQFTDDQVMAMNASYDASNRNFLRVSVSENEYRPVDQPVTLLTPENGEKVQYYNDILFSWEPVPNATFYILDIDGAKYTVTGTEQRIFDRAANEAFLFWSVRAFGPFGGGCSGATEQRFDTGDEFLSAVNDLSFVSEIDFYPNPASKSQELKLTFESERSEAATISLMDVTGKTISVKDHVIRTGQNLLVFDLTNADSGLLLMEVRTESGSLIEKIIVE